MNRIYLLGIWVLCNIAHIIASIWMLVAILVGSKRGWTLAKAYDQLGNATTGGSEDEMISSRAGRALKTKKKWACILCWILNKLEKDHCIKSIEVSTKIG